MKKIYPVFFAVSVILVASAMFTASYQSTSASVVPYAYGNSGVGIDANHTSGLRYGPIEQYLDGNSATSILNAWIENLDNTTKVLTVEKAMCRCQEASGFPFRTGLGQCQYYWMPTASNSRPACQTVTENLTVGPLGRVMVQERVTQVNNQVCGSTQLDFWTRAINGTPTNDAANPWGASFANLVNNCPDPVAPTPTPTVDGATISCSVPSNVTVGQTFTVTMHVQNTGTSTWTPYTNVQANSYRLMSTEPNDNATWGLQRIELGQTVTPGQSVNLTRNFTTPSVAGQYVFNYQMGKEYVARFGSACRQVINVNAANTVVTSTGTNNTNTNVNSGNTNINSGNTTINSGTVTNTVNSGTINNTNSGNTVTNSGNTSYVNTYVSGTQTTSIVCHSNTDCGGNNNNGSLYCSGNSVYRNTSSATCVNAGTTSSYCGASNNNAQWQYNCTSNQTCSYGSCVNNTQSCTQNYSVRCDSGNVYNYDSCGNRGSVAQWCASNQTCSYNTCTNNYNNNYNQQVLSVSKWVRNLSSGNLTWASSVNASPSDVVEYKIELQTLTNNYVNNVVVRDTMPNNLYYKNHLTLDGVSNSGDITTGINIGTINPGQVRTITYQAQVGPAQNFSFGTTTLITLLNVTGYSNSNNYGTNGNYFTIGDGFNNPPVYVTRNGLTGVTNVPTGLTNNLLVDSFLLPLVLALLGVWAYKAGLLNTFGIAEWVGVRKAKFNGANAQKALEQRIAQIKNQERA